MTDSDDEYRRAARKAQQLYELERYDQAIPAFEQVLGADPENAWALAMLSSCFLELGDAAGCQHYAELAIRADPDDGYPFCLLARKELARGSARNAYEHARRAVETDPAPYGLYLLGISALGLGRLLEARVVAEQLLEEVPDEDSSHQIMAMVAEAEHDYGRAAEHLRRALEIDPSNAFALERLAVLHAGGNQHEASAGLFEAALNSDPHDRDRQLAIRDVLHRLAVYGAPGRRLSSIAGQLGAATVALVALWALAQRLLDDNGAQGLVNRAFFFGIPLLLLAGSWLLRERLLAERSPQFALAFRYLRQQVRRQSLLASGVVVACVAGLVAILVRDGADPFWAWSPAWLPFAGAWLALGWMMIDLARRALLDRITRRAAGAPDGIAAAHAWNRRLLLGAGALLLELSARYGSGALFLAAVLAFAAAAHFYFQRHPYATSAATIAGGLALASFAVRYPAVLDLRPGMVALLFVIMGTAMLYLAMRRSFERHLQHRRIRRLLAGRN